MRARRGAVSANARAFRPARSSIRPALQALQAFASDSPDPAYPKSARQTSGLEHAIQGDRMHVKELCRFSDRQHALIERHIAHPFSPILSIPSCSKNLLIGSPTANLNRDVAESASPPPRFSAAVRPGRPPHLIPCLFDAYSTEYGPRTSKNVFAV